MIRTFLATFTMALILASAENGESYEVVEVLVGEPFDLNNFFTCNQSWTVDGETMNMPQVATAGMTSFYKCPSIEKEVFVIVLKKELNMVSGSLGSMFYGQAVKLTCSVEFNTSGFVFDHYMAIMNSSGSIIAEITEKSAKGSDYQGSLEGGETPSYGLNSYLCLWKYKISNEKKEWPQANFDETNTTVEVNKPVGNARISKEVVNRYETVLCLADGYPTITYDWVCRFNDSNEGNWVSKGSAMVMKDSGNFTCNCTATNVIDGKEYWNSWSGIISSYGEGEDFFAAVDGQEKEEPAMTSAIYLETTVKSVIIQTIKSTTKSSTASVRTKTTTKFTTEGKKKVPARSGAVCVHRQKPIEAIFLIIISFSLA